MQLRQRQEGQGGETVSIHWHPIPVANVRIHPAGGGYGAAYRWCATLVPTRHEGRYAAWITGIDRPLTGDAARLIAAACYREGFGWIGWEHRGREVWFPLPHRQGDKP